MLFRLLVPTRHRYAGCLRYTIQCRYQSALTGATESPDGPLPEYERLVQLGSITRDPHQLETLHILQDLSDRLKDYHPHSHLHLRHKAHPSRSGFFSKFFGYSNDDKHSPHDKKKGKKPKGLYIHGGVGCGKTFMMDLFYKSTPVPEGQKQRLHFLDFLIRVHRRMHRLRQEGASGKELINKVIDEMMDEGWLLCFDEFQVTDIADAMVMRQLFEGLWARGLVMVATSNRPPRHLYHNGLQRHLFVPFIDELNKHCQIHSLEASSTDYRLIAGADAVRDVYLSRAAADGERRFERLWSELSRGSRVTSVKLQVQGHTVHVPAAVVGSRVARFTFSELCCTPLGAADYEALCEAFPTLFIANIPKMGLEAINAARRFITLVDTLYERGVKLVCLADCAPNKLFSPEVGWGGVEAMPDEVFAFKRTASRLVEMQGREYLSKCWTPSGPQFLVQFEGEMLTEDNLDQLWRYYDLDHDDKMSRDELLNVMQDVCELKSGHRSVPDEALDWTYTAMDRDKKGFIDKETFLKFGKRFTINIWWGGGEYKESRKVEKGQEGDMAMVNAQ